MILLAVTVVPTMACTPGAPCNNSASNVKIDANNKLLSLDAKVINCKDGIYYSQALVSPKLKQIQNNLTSLGYKKINTISYQMTVNYLENGIKIKSTTPITVFIYSNGTYNAGIFYVYNRSTGSDSILLGELTQNDVNQLADLSRGHVYQVIDPKPNSQLVTTNGMTNDKWLCYGAILTCEGSCIIAAGACAAALLTPPPVDLVIGAACAGGIIACGGVCITAYILCKPYFP